MIHHLLHLIGLDPILVVALLSMAVAQLWKGGAESLQARRLLWRRFVEPGGMPSSHAALVSGLVVGVGLSTGWTSGQASVAIVVALLAMWDAVTVRRAVGEQARVLNALLDRLELAGPKERAGEEEAVLPLAAGAAREAGSELALLRERERRELNELRGHTPLQVLVGALIGTVIALIVFNV
ncbi:MAG: divergent PAP2 family protein [Bacillota bacterium]|nr:divergent PAP2 family protein [Bacillota bacterium]